MTSDLRGGWNKMSFVLPLVGIIHIWEGVLVDEVVWKRKMRKMAPSAGATWDDARGVRGVGWQPDGRGSRQHTGVLWVNVLHAHDICTYSALVDGVVKRWLLCHVVIRGRRCRHADRLPLKSEQEGEKKKTSCKTAFACKWYRLKFSRFLLCKIDINPQNNHQDDGGWNENGESNIGSLHAIIHINIWKKRKEKKTIMVLGAIFNKQRNINIICYMSYHQAYVHSRTALKMLQTNSWVLVKDKDRVYTFYIAVR